ncbi:MAG: pyridoxal-dependent decarboxylase [Methanobrevibacter sp.]|uniref:pyridoxal phosphate-dependent decarboxylase family protein n=1 Tax=Methanobrevibacter sp. TaxID=66852 RepID=UPI0026DEC234|nr:pyridoxal-dependent decarboxylase [Methanobrevibacter sp.]MDO5849561.1 pyridoxal-dependent decarboxylase [Methanobrevibacter sp.]
MSDLENSNMKEVTANNNKVKALFLGEKAENRDFFQKEAEFVINEHTSWRRNFHPEDPERDSYVVRNSPEYQQTLAKTNEVLNDLTSKLKVDSDPWFSQRYLGQMNADTLMVANLAYLATMLYNPNNVAYESSVATSQMEFDVGKQLAHMLGFEGDKAWGHITTDGSVANFEGTWLMRNLKSFPLAVKEVKPDYVKGKSDWELLNMSVEDILDLIIETEKNGDFPAIRKETARGVGAGNGEYGVLIVPQTKHYSWVKATDILGIGSKNLIEIPVDDNYRMSIDALKEAIDECVANKIPIMGVVAVAGTTEEGAVDKVNEIQALREEYAAKGINFYFHIDAAYGGYSRTLYLDENNEFMEYDELKRRIFEDGVFKYDTEYPSKELYDSYKAFGAADSITVDPHKMGYVPYTAGGIAIKNEKILDLISEVAPYVFEEAGYGPEEIGSVILEGSKSGAAAAAVWASHQTIPLNIGGYGEIIGRSIEATRLLTQRLLNDDTIEVNGVEYKVQPLCLEPDFNIVCFAFNPVGNTDLAKMNKLNEDFWYKASYKNGPMYLNDFITSHTIFDVSEYGDSPVEFIERLGIPASEWEKVHQVTVLRVCSLTPILAHEKDLDGVWDKYYDMWKGKLAELQDAQELKEDNS